MTYKESRRKVWVDIFNDWKNSGLTIVNFCKGKGYSKGNFFRWKKRFDDEKIFESGFVSVKLTKKKKANATIKILVGEDIELKLSENISSSQIVKIIDSLRIVC